jgi:hypothetical protein
MSFEPVSVGKYFVATRNDGRYFQGFIESVKALTKGTLVIIRDSDSDSGPVYKSVYLENLSTWKAVPAHEAEALAEEYSL